MINRPKMYNCGYPFTLVHVIYDLNVVTVLYLQTMIRCSGRSFNFHNFLRHLGTSPQLSDKRANNAYRLKARKARDQAQRPLPKVITRQKGKFKTEQRKTLTRERKRDEEVEVREEKNNAAFS